MTREEAIHILDNLKPTNTKSSFDAYVVGKAITMAIKALEQEPTTKNDLGVDCISRQEVLRLLANNIGKSNTYLQTAVFRMPSVTPQEPQSFNWCTDCKEYDQEKHCCHRWSKVIRDTVEEMKQEQEPNTGHWIGCKCDKCGYEVQPWNTTNYCPNCGAKMDLEEIEDEAGSKN